MSGWYRDSPEAREMLAEERLKLDEAEASLSFYVEPDALQATDKPAAFPDASGPRLQAGDVLPVLDPETMQTIAEADVTLDEDGLLVFTVRATKEPKP